MTEFNLSLGRKGKAGEFDSKDLKDGVKKTDLQSKISQNIFDALDNDKDGTLNEIEVEKFLAQLKDAAKNDNLSKREAKKLLKLEGIKGVKAEKLFEFLKEIAAVEVEDDYSAYQDGKMGVDIQNTDKPQPEAAEEEVPEEEIAEEPIDNTKAYYENGRVMTLGEDGKSILVQENENSEPVKLQIDEEGNIISYAKNGESFKMTAKRLGLPTEGPLYDKFKELNEKAAKKGFFLVGGKVKVPADAVEKLALDKVNVNPDNEIAAYTKFMAKKKAENKDETEKPQAPPKSKDLTDEEMRKKYPGIARPDENTPPYEPPKWEMPPVFEPKLPEAPKDDKKPGANPPAAKETAEKTSGGSPKKLNVKKDDFKIENLKKRYPEDKYSEVKGEDGITQFVNKKTGKVVFDVNYNDPETTIGIIYKDGKPLTAMKVSNNKDEFVRVQFDDKGNIKSDATYDGKDGKIIKEEFFNDDRTTSKTINYDKNGRIAEEINYRSQEKNDFLITRFNDDGSLSYKFDAKTRKYESPVANELKELIYAKNSVGLPVSKNKEIKEAVLNKINSTNVKAVIEAYKDATGVELITDIEDEWAISASDMKEINEHIYKCFHDGYQVKDEFEKPNSQVKNEFHTGAEFAVKQKNDIITVTNKSTGKEHQINLEELLRNVRSDKKALLKEIIQDLPGEVLEDLSVEVSNVKTANPRGTIGGFYRGGLFNGIDDISMIQLNKTNFVHEIGHAVDFNGYIINTSTVSDNKKFAEVSAKEMKKYLDSGNKRYISDNKGSHYADDKHFNYCTMNDKEMFAECYTLLMTGNCNSKECILKYFPETLKAVKEHLEDVRKLPESKRH